MESWITYDDWLIDHGNATNDEKNNGIVIIALSEDVKDIKPVTLSSLKYKQVIGKRVATVGWGSINETVNVYPDSLMKGYMTVISYDEYKEISMKTSTRSFTHSHSIYYTLASPTVALGYGDSGGPLVVISDNSLVGVAVGIFKPPLISSDVPVISCFISVDYYRHYIMDVIKEAYTM
ncbi:uncharacterized protein LOC131665363 [Phymastichus coffea]|uniref:uncharacterized protein LOC131665363 n=1 Tax=Phymastichus coffea TaxID=108790 RepID=UPI00273AD638|nr:uncharacterized protein LOC131665363 [Phymastichus coffea]XP_058793202.1 uncharacterized protein LOC131665363 [Phymastichus coffea]XP_058793203.1 uncharacterized protein LOC131665363 [Phymastichus coffea]XP_058793204.1 uncharacterized protein LOC131665363 [Phymastichus coffea]